MASASSTTPRFTTSARSTRSRAWANIVGFIDNPALSRCQIDALLARLQANGFDGVLENEGNLDPPVCP